MKKVLAVLGLVVSVNALAYNDDPKELFSTTKNFTNSSTITWIPQDNVQKACDKEASKRGFGTYGYSVQACSFWDYRKDGSSICTIFTAKNVNMHTIGHEMRHCFQGPWHD
jgi:hypothetical protein